MVLDTGQSPLLPLMEFFWNEEEPMKFLNCLCVFFLALALTGSASAQDPIVVEARLEQTAFFVGEPVVYRVLVRYGPSTRIILDRLQEKNFQMEPFQLISLDISQTEEATFNLLLLP